MPCRGAPLEHSTAHTQPIVLVGGKSRRFGRDKLREHLSPTLDEGNGNLLVQRPIAALRAVFGSRVKLVGACHESLVNKADGTFFDRFPSIGPLGGILSALDVCAGDVFVLAGDMPNISPQSIVQILSRAIEEPAAIAVLATTQRLHPCVGLYRATARPALAAMVEQRQFSLQRGLATSNIATVALDARELVNINHAEDLALAE